VTPEVEDYRQESASNFLRPVWNFCPAGSDEICSHDIRIQVEVFCILTPCSAVVGCQYFRGPWCINFQIESTEDLGSVDFWNVGILPQLYADLERRRPRLETLPPWDRPKCNESGMRRVK